MLKNRTFNRSGTIAIVSVITVIVLVIFVIGVKLFSSVAKTETYYVLSKDVPAQTLVTEDMLKPVSASPGSEPKNILTKADVIADKYYTRIAIKAGEGGTPVPLAAVQKEGETTSGLQSQIPDNWVVTSFSISSDKAVSGSLHTGDFFDMLVVTDQGAFTPFINTLVLGTTLNSQTVSNSDGSKTYTTETVQYIVGLPPQEAARLQHIIGTFDNVVLNVSSESAKQCKSVNMNSYSDTVKWDGSTEGTLSKPFDSIKENPKVCENLKKESNASSKKPSNTQSGSSTHVDKAKESKTPSGSQSGSGSQN